MAWDTSDFLKLTPADLHDRLAAGESVEAVAAHVSLTLDRSVSPDAIRQYVRKFDVTGQQVARNGPDVEPEL